MGPRRDLISTCRRRARRAIGAAALAVLAACVPPPAQRDLPPPAAAAHIVTTERGPRGGRLVLVDEDGARLADLTPIEPRPTIDTNPAWSADGRWIAFASSRGRNGLEQTSLWVVGTRRGAPMERITREPSVDRDPRWSPDGRLLVYASSRGATFDLWAVPLTAAPGGPPRPGRPRRLTATDDLDELGPSISPDGRTVVYMGLDRTTQRSRLYTLRLDGRAGSRRGRPLTAGPADLTPAFSPDGRSIAFAAPVKGRGDIDLWMVDARGRDRRLVVAEPLSDETGPVWSADGRFLFATSVVRSVASGLPILSSIAFVELGAPSRSLRALHDPAQVVPRLGAALAPAALDAGRLRRQPPHDAAVRRAILEAAERAREGQGEEAR